jgi:hypothetical protein
MRLWLLARRGRVRYDENEGFVVRAESESAARELVAPLAMDEGPDCWLAPDLSSCKPIETDGEAEMILQSVNGD